MKTIDKAIRMCDALSDGKELAKIVESFTQFCDSVKKEYKDGMSKSEIKRLRDKIDNELNKQRNYLDTATEEVKKNYFFTWCYSCSC